MPPSSAGQHCPECLFNLGLEPDSIDDFAATVDSPSSGATALPPPPTVEEMNRLLPQLEVLELLGRGGMGAVYKARQRSLDRIVALKVIHRDLASVPGFAERFAREAKSLARLNHPSIVGVYDFGQVDGQYYLVMEYVEGMDLRRLLKTADLEPQQAIAMVPQICEALQYAHDQGVVHRDIKPENILVGTDGKIRIGDFGLAKLVSDGEPEQNLTASHQVMGTLKYMAPEQLEGASSIDHRADIYSLGVVFYELLTGELPLGRFGPPSQKAAIDARLDEIVFRALEKELPNRYQAASQMGAEVEQVSAVERLSSADVVREPPNPHPYAPPVSTPSRPRDLRSAETHVRIIAVLNIAFGMISVLAGIGLFMLLAGIGITLQDQKETGVLAVVGLFVGGFLFFLGVPGVIIGLGLWRFESWARIAAIVLSALSLMNVPLGTLLGMYSLWALLREDSSVLFERSKMADQGGGSYRGGV
ncbi:MAG: serine/threonine-protein kinase [Planctomycetota bacterium]